MSIPEKLTKSVIKGYQRLISPFFKPTCRFQPTCSQYAIEALDRFGFFKGIYLALTRILRCNPLFAFGHDPVPDQFHFITRLKKS
jgi:putative membrane protein insertion efficiency factor